MPTVINSHPVDKTALAGVMMDQTIEHLLN